MMSRATAFDHRSVMVMSIATAVEQPLSRLTPLAVQCCQELVRSSERSAGMITDLSFNYGDIESCSS